MNVISIHHKNYPPRIFEKNEVTGFYDECHQHPSQTLSADIKKKHKHFVMNVINIHHKNYSPRIFKKNWASVVWFFWLLFWEQFLENEVPGFSDECHHHSSQKLSAHIFSKKRRTTWVWSSTSITKTSYQYFSTWISGWLRSTFVTENVPRVFWEKFFVMLTS